MKKKYDFLCIVNLLYIHLLKIKTYIMKKLTIVLAILLASCSGDSMDIPESSLYDLTITTKIESKTYNSFNHVINSSVRMNNIEFYRLSSERLNAERSSRPAGVTVTESSNPKIVVTKTVKHIVKISK